MRDAGLELAIKAAGGVGSLARELGIAQPSVSAWSRIPAERVLAVEALTRVNRFVLRPDLYGPPEDQVKSHTEIDEIDQLRAAEYGLLSLLLGTAPDADTLKRVATLKGDASDLTKLPNFHHTLPKSELPRKSCQTARPAGREDRVRRARPCLSVRNPDYCSVNCTVTTFARRSSKSK